MNEGPRDHHVGNKNRAIGYPVTGIVRAGSRTGHSWAVTFDGRLVYVMASAGLDGSCKGT